MRRDIVSSFLAMIVFTVMLGLVFPLAVTGIGQVAFNNKANGSQISSHGKVVGSALIAQSSRKGDVRYFHPRPSQTSYNPAGTFFNNAGPNNKTTRDLILGNAQAYVDLESKYDTGLTIGDIPVDAATGSASGVDPHISQANAAIQAKRIAAVRQLSPQAVNQLIEDNTDGRSLGVLGESGVNVLKLNLALDKESSK
jgi:K+-transporting ATPase ATPase C chain